MVNAADVNDSRALLNARGGVLEQKQHTIMNIIAFSGEWIEEQRNGRLKTRKPAPENYRPTGRKIVAGPWGGSGFFVPVPPEMVIRGPWIEEDD